MSEQRYAFIPFPPPGARMLHWAIPWERPNGHVLSHLLIPRNHDHRGPGDEFASYSLCLYRDELRGGWHCVTTGTRYAAVQGIKAGQWCYLLGAGEHMRGEALKTVEEYQSGVLSPNEYGYPRDEDRPDYWCVIDLHNLGDHRPTGSKRPADDITITIGDGFASASPREVARKARQELTAGTPTAREYQRRVLAEDVPTDVTHTWKRRTELRDWACSCGMAVTDGEIDRHGGSLAASTALIDKGACRSAFRDRMEKGAPRFVVRPAEEMREGEPCVAYTERETAEKCIERLQSGRYRWVPIGQEGGVCIKPWDGLVYDEPSLAARWGLIDTASPAWQAFDREHRKREHIDTINADLNAGRVVIGHDPGARDFATVTIYECTGDTTREVSRRTLAIPPVMREPDVLPEVAKPSGPTDAEIVEVWERLLRGEEAANGAMAAARARAHPIQWSNPRDGGATALQATYAEYQAARSRELAKRQREAREQERQRITCQGDWPGEGEFDA